jgi:hypothetical protein
MTAVEVIALLAALSRSPRKSETGWTARLFHLGSILDFVACCKAEATAEKEGDQ